MFSHDGYGDDHGVCRANMAHAHTQWRHLVALQEATDMLLWAICLASYLLRGMVVTITINSITFYYIVDNT